MTESFDWGSIKARQNGCRKNAQARRESGKKGSKKLDR
jgi:hypothetical protein